MPECPNCHHCFPLVERLCQRKIAFSTAKYALPVLIKRSGKSELQQKLYAEILKIIAEMPAETKFRTGNVTHSLGLEWATNNDKILICLALMCCRGIIQRIAFNNEKEKGKNTGRGHLYIKRQTALCEFAIEKGCSFPKESFV